MTVTTNTPTTTTRPSQARIRKSISKRSRREVTWCPTEESVQEAISYHGTDHAQIWWSQDELREIRQYNFVTVSKDMEGQDTESEHESMRGLEIWTDQGGWERFQHVQACYSRVLDEQDRQRGIDATESQNTAYPIVKRINHMHIPFDHNRLGALCRDATAKARRASVRRGKRDAKAILEKKTVVEAAVEAAISKDKVKELCKVFEQHSDDHTVQTEAMTHDDDMHMDDHDASPVPAMVSFGVTPEFLQAKQKARLATYLNNREKRIEAQIQKDFEWEQRRLARKVVLNKEYDEHLEKMHSLIRATNQLIKMVESSRQ